MLEENVCQTITWIDEDLGAVDARLTHCHREIDEVCKDIDLLHAPAIDMLARLEYLEEMDVEREKRINGLEVLASMRSHQCCPVLHPRSQEHPIKVDDLDYADKYHTPPISSTSEPEEGKVQTDRSIKDWVPDVVTILCPFTPERSVHLS